MIFEDRYEAGLLLAKRLAFYSKNPEALVVAIPRGGVVTAFPVSQKLSLQLRTLVIRKIGAPGNLEMAIGAIGPNEIIEFDKDLIESLQIKSPKDILEQVENSKQKLKDYSKKFKTRKTNLEAKIVILVDDGIATGSSVNAAIKYLRLKKVKKIILASPVAPADTAHELRSKVDEAVILDVPANFQSVGQFYKNFPEVPDAEVVQLLQKTK